MNILMASRYSILRPAKNPFLALYLARIHDCTVRRHGRGLHASKLGGRSTGDPGCQSRRAYEGETHWFVVDTVNRSEGSCIPQVGDGGVHERYAPVCLRALFPGESM